MGYLDWLVDRAGVQGQGRRDRGQARRPCAALDVEHEARHRAVRPGRARHPEDPRRHPRVPDLGGPARGPERACANAGRPLRAAAGRPCSAASPRSHADLAGFTRMMEGAETRTFRHLKSARRSRSGARPSTAGGGGWSAPRATPCWPSSARRWRRCAAAIDIQERMARFNETLDEDQRMMFRIGVHLGEVIVDEEDHEHLRRRRQPRRPHPGHRRAAAASPCRAPCATSPSSGSTTPSSMPASTRSRT